jgi:hypothetical protein
MNRWLRLGTAVAWFAVGLIVAVTGTAGHAAAPAVLPCTPSSNAPFPMLADMSAVTCFSGIDASLKVQLDMPVVAVIDTRSPETKATAGINWCADMYHNDAVGQPTAHYWHARNLGQVFGVALDDSKPPNIYVAASTVYGDSSTGVTPTFGSAGGGGVYRLEGQTNGPKTAGDISVYASLPNVPAGLPADSGPGLGNLAFMRAADGSAHLYVTNFNDGGIYNLDASGAVATCIEVYYHDEQGLTAPGPCPAVAANAGFIPLTSGKRLWAVRPFRQDRLYYSVWWEDRDRRDPTHRNEVWSVGLDAGGKFVVSPTAKPVNAIPSGIPEYDISFTSTKVLTTMPVSDIRFSSDGPTARMMLAQRVMKADVGPGNLQVTNTYGHAARNLEYVSAGPNAWTAGGANSFWIGTAKSILHAPDDQPGYNASGGIDYDCSGNLWSTGHALLLDASLANSGLVYGLQRTDKAGNAVSTIKEGYFIDFDGVASFRTKAFIGSVALFRDCAGVPPPVTECRQVYICHGLKDTLPGIVNPILLDPGSVAGWSQLSNPNVPEGPMNTRRCCLCLHDVSRPFDARFNPLEWKAGCPCPGEPITLP